MGKQVGGLVVVLIDGWMEGWHGETYAQGWGGWGAIWPEELFADAAAPADGQTGKVASGHLPGQMQGWVD
jgi:hypothetical protein